jgi:hypothetical protein
MLIKSLEESSTSTGLPNIHAAKDVGSIVVQVFRVHNMSRCSWSHEGVIAAPEAELTEKLLKGESKSHSSA